MAFLMQRHLLTRLQTKGIPQVSNKKEQSMITINMPTTASAAAAKELRAVMQGRVVVAGEEGYARVRQIWNGATEHLPALFAICETVGDVRAAVQVARTHHLPLSVRGGGHDCSGRALRHRGLVIDLREMREV
jgi:hypothetical protein